LLAWIDFKSNMRSIYFYLTLHYLVYLVNLSSINASFNGYFILIIYSYYYSINLVTATSNVKIMGKNSVGVIIPTFKGHLKEFWYFLSTFCQYVVGKLIFAYFIMVIIIINRHRGYTNLCNYIPI